MVGRGPPYKWLSVAPLGRERRRSLTVAVPFGRRAVGRYIKTSGTETGRYLSGRSRFGSADEPSAATSRARCPHYPRAGPFGCAQALRGSRRMGCSFPPWPGLRTAASWSVAAGENPPSVYGFRWPTLSPTLDR